MKQIYYRYAIPALIVSMTLMSCSGKESPQTPIPPEPGPEPAKQVEICMRGEFKDVESKAEIKNILRLTWAENDTVSVYGKPNASDVFTKLGTLYATPVEGTSGRAADLKGTITAPETGKTMTMVFSSGGEPILTDGTLSADFASQGGKSDSAAFVAYAAVKYTGETGKTYRESFKLSTGAHSAQMIPGIAA